MIAALEPGIDKVIVMLWQRRIVPTVWAKLWSTGVRQGLELGVEWNNSIASAVDTYFTW
jgi:hypothetical protein